MRNAPKHIPGGFAVNTGSRFPFLSSVAVAVILAFPVSAAILVAWLTYAAAVSGYPIMAGIFGTCGILTALGTALMVRGG